MRLDKVWIDGFKNLHQLEVDFDADKLTTVVIGQNGTGKSNLIEAIARIFRWVDLRRLDPHSKPPFRYRVDYRIGEYRVSISSSKPGEHVVFVDGRKVPWKEFEERKSNWFPDLVFGYYSGSSRRLESLFDAHQKRYYDAIKLEEDEKACWQAQFARRLFYCRPIHGVMAVLALFAFPDRKVIDRLRAHLGIAGFHSLLAQFREPWFARNDRKSRTPEKLWGAKGPAGRTARLFQSVAFHPIALEGNAIDDYRDKKQVEPQYATFLRSLDDLKRFAKNFSDEQDLFYALEAMDISDLVREIFLWVTRTDETTGDVGFADLSDGERQLLMVLGLIRVSRGQRALFLLDEPDTHLNPHWQHSYLKLIEDWTGIASNADNCHIVLTSHNPLTISALTREEVRVLSTDKDGTVTATAPYVDPRGMGFTTTLTEIFGLPTSLDQRTQRMVDIRNRLAQRTDRTDTQQKRLLKFNDLLARMGFLLEDRDPLYESFLRAWHDVRYANRPPLSPQELDAQHRAMKTLIEELRSRENVV